MPAWRPPRWPLVELPAVSAAQMGEIDRLATDEFGIALEQMMELAGAALARVAAGILGAAPDRRVSVLIGPGHNGGGGLVAARHLANRGALVSVILAVPVSRLRPLAQDRLATLIEMRLPSCVVPWDFADGELDDLLAGSDLLVDALLGYSAKGPPRGAVVELLDRAAASRRRVVSLDLPSGMDPDSGLVDGSGLAADATVTIALPKSGLLSAAGRARAGSLYLADIGLPAALYERAGLAVRDPFEAGSPVRLD